MRTRIELLTQALVIVVVVIIFSSTLAAAKQSGPRKSRFRSGSEVRNAPRASKPVYSDEKHNIVNEDGRNIIYKKRNTVDLDDNLLEGELRNPNDFYFVHRPEEQFGTLVKKRKNFHKEMLRDTVMIR